VKDDLAVFPLVDIGFSSLGLRSSPFMGYWIHWILAMMGLFLFLTQYSIIHLRCRWVHVRMLDAFVGVERYNSEANVLYHLALAFWFFLKH
jgi:hypothetical protein